MKMKVEWQKLIVLEYSKGESIEFENDIRTLANGAGVYVFGRKWGSNFEALYVGKAINVRARIKTQRNSLKLMKHIRDAKTGKRVLLIGLFRGPEARARESITLIERTLIRHFLSGGHDLANKAGTLIRKHEVVSSGFFRKTDIPARMSLEKRKGE